MAEVPDSVSGLGFIWLWGAWNNPPPRPELKVETLVYVGEGKGNYNKDDVEQATHVWFRVSLWAADVHSLKRRRNMGHGGRTLKCPARR